MHPPSHVCRRLYELDPQVRLAWTGWKPTYPGELNAGTFCIIQLWDRDHFGAHDRPNTPSELWNIKPYPTTPGNFELRRIDRGPVFNRNGGTTPDWNMCAMQLVYRMNLKDFGISNEDVVTGRILEKLDRFYSPLKARIEADERATQSDIKNTAEAVGREQGMRLHRALNQHNVTYMPASVEEQIAGVRAREEQRQHRAMLRGLL